MGSDGVVRMGIDEDAGVGGERFERVRGQGHSGRDREDEETEELRRAVLARRSIL